MEVMMWLDEVNLLGYVYAHSFCLLGVLYERQQAITSQCCPTSSWS